MRQLTLAAVCLVGALGLLLLRPDKAATSAPHAPQAVATGAAQPAGHPPLAVPSTRPWRRSAFTGGTLLGSAGQPWQASTDARQGGSSTAALAGLEDSSSDGFLRVSGELAAGAAYPWAGAIWMLGATPMQPIDASGMDELVLRVRGDRRGLMLILLSGEPGAGPSMQPLSSENAWQTHRFALSSFTGADLRRLRAVLVAASLPEGEFRFDLDGLVLQ